MDDFDHTLDVVVQCFEFFSGYPPLRVVWRTDLLNGKATHESRIDFEACHEAVTTGRDISVLRDFDGVGLIGDRIEDGLLRKSGRSALKSAGCDQG